MLGSDDLIAYIPRPFVHLIAAVGLFAIARFVLKTAGVFLQTLVLPGTSLARYASKSGSGSWAVVTGATDGIGEEFAHQLAKTGFNILLISRTQEKLRNAAAAIEDKYQKVQTKTLAIDFSAPKESDYAELEKICSALDVGVLVNNVGRSHDIPVSFAETPLDEMQNIITINVTGTLRVTQVVLKKMLAQRRGLILTISSFAGSVPSPMLATYSGSKAFLNTWSDALQAELKGTGVDVSCVSTYFVTSKLSKIRRPSATTPTAKAYVSTVLRKINQPCGALWTARPSFSTPYWSHAFIDYIMNVVGWKGLFIKYSLDSHKDIRKRALRKREREAEGTKKKQS